MILQDVRGNAMEACIKNKAYYDKKANASKLKQSDYVYILQPKAQINKKAKFPLQIFGGLDHILLKKYYRTIVIWYSKLAPIKRKFFTE